MHLFMILFHLCDLGLEAVSSARVWTHAATLTANRHRFRGIERNGVDSVAMTDDESESDRWERDERLPKPLVDQGALLGCMCPLMIHCIWVLDRTNRTRTITDRMMMIVLERPSSCWRRSDGTSASLRVSKNRS
ncbi:hypothetical protein C8Q74DRAFT_1305954 [Fomes fomentarius]|nr:hypothetical protein C8Q74DRAFT_1305954 [Fomes fomentarius]